MTNKEVVKIFRNVAAAYEVRGEPFFKVVAYNKAADAIEQSPSDVKELWEEKKLGTLPGIGSSFEKYLDELFKTGKVKHFKKVIDGLPKGMFEINGIPNIGPKTAYKIASQLKVENLDDLRKVAETGQIKGLEGFGEKSEMEILEAIAQVQRRTGRMLLAQAYEIAQKILDWMKKDKSVERVDTLGSLRRMVSTIGDIDIAVATQSPKSVISHFINYPKARKIIDKGEKSASVLLENDIQVDLKTVEPKSYGALLQHFTGSKDHNIHLRELALKKGWSLSEYGIKIGKKINYFPTEEEFYKKLGMDWIPPEIREDSGEIERAQNHNLPRLVSVEDIRGDLHLHSSFDVKTSHDLGRSSFSEIIKKAKSLSYEYIGFSNHTPALGTHTVSEVKAIVKRQTKEIEQLKTSRVINILNGFEVDILTYSSLSLPDDILKDLDFVIAGIHSSLSQTKEKATERILSALKNPYVNIISHPTGRLLNEREGYELDWDKIFDECKKSGKIFEINAWPQRLDLFDTMVREAVKNGVKMIINTDSHAVEQMDNMKYGVSVARRGWAESKDIINTLPWVEFKKFFRVK